MSDTTLTLCFSGTSNWPDQGEQGRPADEIKNFSPLAGYIPSRTHALLSDSRSNSHTIPGCGPPYQSHRKALWLTCWNRKINPESGVSWPESSPPPRHIGDEISGHSVNDLAAHAMALLVGARVQVLNDNLTPAELKLEPSKTGAEVARKLGLKDTDEITPQIKGSPRLYWRPDDLALLGDKAQRLSEVNLIGHSRGGVITLAVTNLIALYLPHIKVNIIALDPVPGTGKWPENMCILPGSVLGEYLGIYAVDEVSIGFNGVVPRIRDTRPPVSQKAATWDPLTQPITQAPVKPCQYKLIFSRGRHSTIPGSWTRDGDKYSEGNTSPDIGAVGDLIFYLCQNRLRNWGVPGATVRPTAVQVDKLKKTILDSSDEFYLMRHSTYPTTAGHAHGAGFHKGRGISSSKGRNPKKWSYMEIYLPEETTLEQGRKPNKKWNNPTSVPHAPWLALTDLHNSDFGAGR